MRTEHIFGRKLEYGFTLIELLAAMAVSSILLSAIGATMYQMWTNNTRNSSHMVAVKQVENALHFLTRDVQMAQNVETSDLTGNEVLKLSWVSWEADTSVITYTWDPFKYILTRTKSEDGTTTTVAYAVEERPVFTELADKLTVTLKCTFNGASETRVIDIKPRTGM